MSVCTLEREVIEPQSDKIHLICPKCVQQAIEKNWSLWEHADEHPRISYKITGTHQFLVPNENGNFTDCTLVSDPPQLDKKDHYQEKKECRLCAQLKGGELEWLRLRTLGFVWKREVLAHLDVVA